MKCLFSIVLLMLCYKEIVFKESRNLLFSSLSYFCNMKNVYSKQVGDCFYFIQPLLYNMKKAGVYFSNTKNTSSKQARAAFQFIKLLLKYEKCKFKKSGAAFQFIKLSLFSYFCNSETCVQMKQEAAFQFIQLLL